MGSTPAIDFRDLTLGYGRRPAVHHVNGEVAQGELLALVGPNGAGKSTLLKGIMSEIKPLDGKIDLHGLSHRDIAYLPQQIDIDRSFPISVFDCVAMGLWREISILRGLDQRAKRKVAEALTALGILDLANRPIGALSGGQFQRVLFILLMRRWHDEGRTVIAALHDIDQVRASFGKTLLLAREVVAWGDTRKVLTVENLAKARAAVETWEEHAEICDRHDAVQDEVKEPEPA